jgi:hypothetical protein
VRDLAAAIDEHAHLPTRLVREAAELPRDLLGDEAFRRQSAPQQALEISELARLQALGIAVDRDRGTSFRTDAAG